jgi:hypothetical protein
MNIKYTTLLAAGALMVGAHQSQALTWSDAQNPNLYMNAGGPISQVNGTKQYTGTFDIQNPGTDTFAITSPYPGLTVIADDTTPGFTPGLDIATGATASFWFRDDLGDGGESVTIQLDAAAFSGGTVTQNGVSVFSGPANILVTINATGQVSYQINANDGDFFFDYAYLSVDGERRQIGTPDGGTTAALLGLGSLGIAALRRKLS